MTAEAGGEIKTVLNLDDSKFSAALAKAIEGLDKFDKTLTGSFGAVGNFEKSFKNMANGVTSISKQFQSVENSLANLSAKLAASAAGIDTVARSSSRAGRSMRELSDGLTPVQRNLANAAREAGQYRVAIDMMKPSMNSAIAANEALSASQMKVASSSKTSANIIAQSSKVAKDAVMAESDARIKSLERERAANDNLIAQNRQRANEYFLTEQQLRRQAEAIDGNSIFVRRQKKAGGAATVAANDQQSFALNQNANFMQAQMLELNKQAEALAAKNEELAKAQTAELQRQAEIVAEQNNLLLRRRQEEQQSLETESQKTAELQRQVEVIAEQKRAQMAAAQAAREQAAQVAQMWKGFAELWGASKIEGGIKQSVNAADEMQRERVRVQSLDYSPAHNQAIYQDAADMSRKLGFLSETEALKSRMSAIASVGYDNESMFKQTLPTVVTAANNLKELGLTHGDFQNTLRNIYGVVEMRQQTGSAKDTNDTADLIQKIILKTQGKVQANDLETVMRRLGIGAAHLSDHGMLNVAAIIDQFKVMGGDHGGGSAGVSTVGTMIKMFQAYAIGKTLSNKAVEQLSGAGILNAGGVNLKNDHAGILRDAKHGGLLNPQLWLSDPVAAMQSIMPKIIAYTQNEKNRGHYYQGRNINDPSAISDAVAQYLTSLGFTTTAVQGAFTMGDPRSAARIAHQVSTMGKTIGGTNSDLSKTYARQLTSFDQQLTNLKMNLGTSLLPAFTKMLSLFNKIIVAASEFAANHQFIAQTALIAAGFTGITLAIKGTMSLFGFVGSIPGLIEAIGKSFLTSGAESATGAAAMEAATTGVGAAATETATAVAASSTGIVAASTAATAGVLGMASRIGSAFLDLAAKVGGAIGTLIEDFGRMNPLVAGLGLLTYSSSLNNGEDAQVAGMVARNHVQKNFGMTGSGWGKETPVAPVTTSKQTGGTGGWDNFDPMTATNPLMDPKQAAVYNAATADNKRQYEDLFGQSLANIQSRRQIDNFKLTTLATNQDTYQAQAQTAFKEHWLAGQFDPGHDPTKRPFKLNASGGNTLSNLNTSGNLQQQWMKEYEAAKRLEDRIKGLTQAKQLNARITQELADASSRSAIGFQKVSAATRALHNDFARLEARNPSVLTAPGYQNYKSQALAGQQLLDMNAYQAKLQKEQDHALKTEAHLHGMTFNAKGIITNGGLNAGKNADGTFINSQQIAIEDAMKAVTDATTGKNSFEAYTQTAEGKKWKEANMGNYNQISALLDNKVSIAKTNRAIASQTPLDRLTQGWQNTQQQIMQQQQTGAQGLMGFVDQATNPWTFGGFTTSYARGFAFRSMVSSQLLGVKNVILNGLLGGPISALYNTMGNAFMNLTGIGTPAQEAAKSIASAGGVGGAGSLTSAGAVLSTAADSQTAAAGALEGSAASLSGAASALAGGGMMGAAGAVTGGMGGATSVVGGLGGAAGFMSLFNGPGNPVTSPALSQSILTGATAASDPITSLMSAIGFANGGIMTSFGPVQLNKYANGGIANSPQLALFGEAGPEAYVPLPDGRSIPVSMSGPQSSTTNNAAKNGNGAANVTISIVVNGGSSTQSSSASSGTNSAAQNAMSGMAAQIKGIVMQEMVNQQRPGGLLYK